MESSFGCRKVNHPQVLERTESRQGRVGRSLLLLLLLLLLAVGFSWPFPSSGAVSFFGDGMFRLAPPIFIQVRLVDRAEPILHPI